ncbi:MAG: hypothetical protein GOVbin2833_13 [Prokaryotic dsDNA virus sp.]|nr:MAG: hypothetical protein GOVbin2833_13 [Prokaryotic dsDNA virus sp.]|tara:strand:- start:16862 stop:17251 length:390 start_codon:yes stop_codon:yes gene_type:complete
MAVTPTQRTLKHMRGMGLLCEVVERWIPQARRRHDLYNIIDILGVGVLDGEPTTIGVQATSRSNHGSRIKKILESDTAEVWLGAGNRLQVVSWGKIKKKWQVKVTEFCLDGAGVVRAEENPPSESPLGE